MKKRRQKSIVAIFMAMLMAITLIPSDVTLVTAYASPDTYTATPSAVLESDKDASNNITNGAVIATCFELNSTNADKKWKYTADYLDGGASSALTLKYTVQSSEKVGTLTIVAKSNGSTKATGVILKDKDGEIVAEKDGKNTLNGSGSNTTLVYTGLTASRSPYTLSNVNASPVTAPDGYTLDGKIRLISATASEESSSASGTAPVISTVTATLKADTTDTISGSWTESTAGTGDGKVIVEVYKGDTKVTGAEVNESAKTFEYKMTASGAYTVKVYGQLGSDTSTKTTAVTSTPAVNYVLPLETPVIKEVKEGDEKLTVSWDKVKEATAYVIKVYEGSTEVKSVDLAGDKSEAVVEGLTNGKTYTVKLTAKRDDPEAEKTSEAKEASPYKPIDTSNAIPGMLIYNADADNTVSINRTKGLITLGQNSTGSKVDSSGLNKLSYIITPDKITGDFELTADVTVASLAGSSNGIFFGAMADKTGGKSPFTLLDFRGDGAKGIVAHRSKTDTSVSSSSLESDTKVTLDKKYTIKVSRAGTSYTYTFSGNGASQSKTWAVGTDLHSDLSGAVYVGLVIGGAQATVENLKIKKGDTVVFDASTLTDDFSAFIDNWSSVSNPVITSVTKETGKITVNTEMVIGEKGAGTVTVKVIDKDGKVVASKDVAKTGTTQTFEITDVKLSGDYKIVAEASRPGVSDVKKSAEYNLPGYVATLEKPKSLTAFSNGNGAVSVKWEANSEATNGYRVSYKEDTAADSAYVVAGTTTDTNFTVTGLNVGTKYTFKVECLRGSESASDVCTATATNDAKYEWNYAGFGSSTDAKDKGNNGFTGDANEGQVTVFSLGGKGKIVPNTTDGLAFYYTAIPSNKNFTLSAKVHVDQWKYSNGQEGFGVMAADRVGKDGDSSAFWNNSYMAIASKVEYFLDEEGNVKDSGTKYSMKLGVGSLVRTGVTAANLDKFQENDSDTINKYFTTETKTLETSAFGQEAGTYNIIANYTGNTGSVDLGLLTDLILTVRKNNTGYFVSYTDMNGKTVTNKYYSTEDLSQIDKDYVYAGFFASRNAEATFTDINLTIIDPSQDEPKEERPITYVTPQVKLLSPTATGNSNYKAVVWANAAGTFEIEGVKTHVDAETQFTQDLQLKFGGANFLKLKFTPDAGYSPAKYTQLSSYETIDFSQNVVLNPIGNFAEALYVAPNGSSTGAGTKTSPLDIYTATKFAQAGQQIVLMEGTYLLDKTVKTSRGNDGNANAMIYMIADPEAKSRPVLDFQGACQGIQASANYWYFQGFDVTRSQNGQKGVNLSGSNCVFDMVNFYHNGNTGLQISRESAADTREQWPSNNLIKNCTSYGNADAGYEDADGFAAKLTCGEGNVFDGCIAHHNADDGWDLFAKAETGNIGMVTIMNSIAYSNGYLEDGTNAGNGNGFKMGGESLSGYHTIKNSIAFNNKAKGFDSNSCPDIQIENCTSFNNESYNVAIYTNNAKNTDYSVTGYLSFRQGVAESTNEQIKTAGSQDSSKIRKESNYFWEGGKSANTNGALADASWFVSLDTSIVPTRNADGSIDMHGLLQATSACPSNTGARLEAVQSVQIEAFKPATSVGGNDDDTSDDSGNGSDAKPETNNNATPGSTDSNNGTTNNTVTIAPSGLAVIGQNVAVTVPAGTVIKDVNGNVITSGQVFVKAIGEDATSAARLSDAMKAQGIAFTEGTGVKYYEVTFIDANGNPLTFEGTLNVSFTYPEGTNANDYEFKVLHLLKSGTVDVMDPTATAAGLTVSVTELSPFAVAYAKVESEGATKGLVSADTADVAPIVPLAAVLFACVGAFAYAYTSKKRSF